MNLNFQITKQAAMRLRAVNHKLRNTIMDYIDKKGETDVTHLYNALGLEQSVASQHLAILRRAHIVKTRRDGKFIYYSIDYKSLDRLMELAQQMVKGN